MRHIIPTRRAAIAAALAALTLGASDVASAQRHEHGEQRTAAGGIAIPASIRAEHEAIHAELTAATRAPGAVGAAARDLAAALHPHFVREEQIALPPLSLLAPLARGKWSPAMRDVLPLTDSLRAELPRMLEEHGAIRAATLHLRDVARAAGDTTVTRLAEKLALHARSEEEVLYPAAVLVGDLVKLGAPPGR